MRFLQRLRYVVLAVECGAVVIAVATAADLNRKVSFGNYSCCLLRSPGLNWVCVDHVVMLLNTGMMK